MNEETNRFLRNFVQYSLLPFQWRNLSFSHVFYRSVHSTDDNQARKEATSLRNESAPASFGRRGIKVILRETDISSLYVWPFV